MPDLPAVVWIHPQRYIDAGIVQEPGDVPALVLTPEVMRSLQNIDDHYYHGETPAWFRAALATVDGGHHAEG